jgi:hypothetical protein
MSEFFTAREKAAEARRETAFRRRVYKRLVAEGRMTPDEAARRLALMTEIEADYVKLVRSTEELPL